MTTLSRLALMAAATVLAQPALAEIVTDSVELTGAAQVPPVETAGTGTAEVTVDTEGMTVAWVITYEGLTGEPVAGHFHAPAGPDETAPPTLDIFADLAEGSVEVTAEQMEQITSGMSYINIHTAEYPDGEIRGQVMAMDAAE